MALYRSIGSELRLLRESPFALEREMQNVIEAHLAGFLGLQLVRSEFSVSGFRLDTLAYDQQSRAFVIVEYKKDRNFSVIDQGYAYLSAMLNNKAEFILEYYETQNTNLARRAIDWSQSRVIFVAPSFTPYQLQSIRFRDIPIELWEFKRFEGNLLSLNKVKEDGASESVRTLSSGAATSPIIEVSQEIRVYSEEEHLAGKPDRIVDLYKRLREQILALGNVEVKATKLYIAFVANHNFVDITLQRSFLKIWLNVSVGHLDDPKGLARDVSHVGHWGNGDYEIKVDNDQHFIYLMDLVEQAYRYQMGVA